MVNHFIDTKKRYAELSIRSRHLHHQQYHIIGKKLFCNESSKEFDAEIRMKRHKARLLFDVELYTKIIPAGTTVYLDLGPGSGSYLSTNPRISVSTHFIMYPKISVPINFLEELDGSPLIVKEVDDESDE